MWPLRSKLSRLSSGTRGFDHSGLAIGGGSGAPARRARRRPCAHDQHLEPAPRSARCRIPPTVLRHELVDGSGGAGRFCGGMGLRRAYRAEAECHLRLDGSRLLTLPWGLGGIIPADTARFDLATGSSRSSMGAAFYTPDRRSKSSLPERRLWPSFRARSWRSSVTLLINASIPPPRRQCILSSEDDHRHRRVRRSSRRAPVSVGASRGVHMRRLHPLATP
jgi:hypothetical protein